jgi:serine/threonine-protein kinase HipA
MATLSVYFEQRRVGTIDIDKNGPGFTYDPGWVGLKGAFPISITMPLRSERIASDTFLPWAANLLPESEQLRTLGQLLGMARGDVIGLLSANWRRHRGGAFNWSAWENCFASLAPD